MTGAYIRIERYGKWQNIEMEHLTNEEREKLFEDRGTGISMIEWLNFMCNYIKNMEPEQ